MKRKTSTRISIIFSIFTFFIILILLILLNIFSFFGWYNEERDEIVIKIDTEYQEILKKYTNNNVQKKELLEDIEELGGFINSGDIINNYNKIFLELYYKNDLFYIIHEKESKFGSIFLPYDVSSHFHNQIRLINIGITLLIIFSILSFIISKYLFTRLALKDIFYISGRLKNINLNNIEKVELDLNKNDEINVIVNSINNFLDIIGKNTRSLKQFNSQVSHEFKTPLMIISSELEYLSLSGKNNESYIKIEKQVELLNELLETFLFISKIENYKGDIKKNNTNINKIIKEKLDNLNIIYKDKNIQIKENFDKIIKLNTNKKLLELALKNILDNAFKYNKKGGTIEIILNKNYLIIKDTGIGIEKENLNNIFNSFYRVDDKGIGYGVGLNIVQKIIYILGYKLDVKSKKNIETEFKITF